MTTARNKQTVEGLHALKGKPQLSKLRVTTLDETEAAEHAGMDLFSVTYALMLDKRFRDVAPTLLYHFRRRV